MIQTSVLKHLGVFFAWLSPPNFIFIYNKKTKRFWTCRTKRTIVVSILYEVLTYIIADFSLVYTNLHAFLIKTRSNDKMAGLHLVYCALFLVIGALCLISSLNLLVIGERLAFYANTMICYSVTTLQGNLLRSTFYKLLI